MNWCRHQVIENYVATFVSAKSMTSRVISGADHALTSERAQRAYDALLEGWLSETVVGARTGLAGHGKDASRKARDGADGEAPATASPVI